MGERSEGRACRIDIAGQSNDDGPFGRMFSRAGWLTPEDCSHECVSGSRGNAVNFHEGLRLRFETSILAEACGQHDPEQLVVEVTCLNGLGIIDGMFFSATTEAVNLAPNRLGAAFYVRCQGS